MRGVTDVARSEAAEVAALADSWRAAPAELATREGISLLEADGVTALSVRSLPGSRVHNHVYGVADVDDVERVEAFYRERDCPFVLSTAPGASLDTALEKRGYTRGYAWMKFVRGLAPLESDTSLRIAEIGGEAGAVFGAIVATGFGMPDWTADWIARLPGRSDWVCFVSYAGPEPAGAGALFVAGEVGWLGFGSTLPEHRGRGSQTALLAARVDAARARGCTRLTTETGVQVEGRQSGSYRNILRTGFTEAGARDNWAPPAPPAVDGPRPL